jgi:hypothetical protein
VGVPARRRSPFCGIRIRVTALGEHTTSDQQRPQIAEFDMIALCYALDERLLGAKGHAKTSEAEALARAPLLLLAESPLLNYHLFQLGDRDHE